MRRVLPAVQPAGEQVMMPASLPDYPEPCLVRYCLKHEVFHRLSAFTGNLVACNAERERQAELHRARRR